MRSSTNLTGGDKVRKASVSVMLFVALLTAFSSSASADTGINTCQDLTSSGVYNLTADIDASSAGAYCISINSSDVTLDGQNYTIDGDNSSCVE